MDPSARHVFVGHAFVAPHGGADNTSESERPLAIGGTEYVEAGLFEKFHYTALGHLHQAHYVLNETIRYAGSILKYSISEEHHKKGFYVVHLDGEGRVSVEKRLLKPKHDMRSVEAYMDDLLTHPVNEDYVFVTLLDSRCWRQWKKSVPYIRTPCMWNGKSLCRLTKKNRSGRAGPPSNGHLFPFQNFLQGNERLRTGRRNPASV